MTDDSDAGDDRSAFEDALRASLDERDASDDEAVAAAANAGAFRDDWDEALATEDVLDLLDAAPYDDFGHRFDYAIGELAADVETCTDSRAYRLAGFGDLAADPEQSA
jgi:hypothetical protein